MANNGASLPPAVFYNKIREDYKFDDSDEIHICSIKIIDIKCIQVLWMIMISSTRPLTYQNVFNHY